MREIKFRAWTGKEMIYYPEWFTLEGQHVLCFEEPPHSYVDESDIDNPNRVELMQYTGLKDKNGKEIYEGDIVKNERHYFTTSVEYYGSSFNCKSEGLPLHTFIDEHYGEDSAKNSIEVIGNIYENPELLTN